MFKSSGGMRPLLDMTGFPKLTNVEIEMLEEPFSPEDIIEAIKGCNRNKSPGPDKFNFEFLQCYWEVVGEDVINCIQELLVLLKVLFSSFIDLIPKKLNPQDFEDYRVISLVGCIYKVT